MRKKFLKKGITIIYPNEAIKFYHERYRTAPDHSDVDSTVGGAQCDIDTAQNHVNIHLKFAKGSEITTRNPGIVCLTVVNIPLKPYFCIVRIIHCRL